MTQLLFPDQREKDLEGILETLFASSARVAVLRLFLLDPTRAYYQRQIESATGLPIRAVQRELLRLQKVGLIFRRVDGNRVYYRADLEFPLFLELRGLFLRTANAYDALRALLSLREDVLLAFASDTRDEILVITVGEGLAETMDQPLLPHVTTMSEAAFREALLHHDPALDPFLVRGVDMLGRREEVIWRYIEAAGYTVPKGEGVP